MSKSSERLDRIFDRIVLKLPWAAGTINWLRSPAGRWIRLPASILLILGGIFSILPGLGLWMLPLGLLFLSIDVGFLQDPVTRAIIWVENKWKNWRKKKKTGIYYKN